jgi:hypothetical protein
MLKEFGEESSRKKRPLGSQSRRDDIDVDIREIGLMKETRNTCTISVGKPLGECQLGRPGRFEDCIKMVLRNIGCTLYILHRRNISSKAFHACEGLERHTKLLQGNLKGRDNLRSQGVGGRIILKWIERGLDLCSSGYGLVAGCCE